MQATVKAELAFARQSSPPIRMLMSKAELTQEEATRVLMVYIAYWNYVVQMVPVVDDLSVPEREKRSDFVIYFKLAG